jgi:hypothetical protein
MTNKVLTQDEIDTQSSDYELARSEGRVLFMKCQQMGRTMQEIFYDIDRQEWYHNHRDWVCAYVYDGETLVNQLLMKPQIKETHL